MSAYEGWARVELMGHRVRLGRIAEVEAFGSKMMRIDVPEVPSEAPSDKPLAKGFVEFYSGGSIFSILPALEEEVRHVLLTNARLKAREAEEEARWRAARALPPSEDDATADDDSEYEEDP